MMKRLEDEDILELYLKGLTNREIADALGATQPAIHYRLVRLGLANNCRKDLTADPVQVRILHGMGLTSIGIAHLLKVNATIVQMHLNDMGLEDNCVKLREISNQ